MKRSSAATLLVLLTIAACGAPKVPQTALESSSSPASSGAGPATTASAEPTTTDMAVPTTSATAASSEPPKTAPGAITMDDDDGCTPIAAAFERKARPKIKECYREGKKDNALLEGGVRIVIAVDAFGKLGAVKTQDVTLPKKVADCMVTAVKSTPFDDAAKCKRKGITLPIQFPSK
jgi:hypothetical protein